ncbi:MAG: hypothetical protein AAGD96_13825 [Chloroflexota bacterium]
MSNRSKVLIGGCLTPLILILACSAAIYFRSDLFLPIVGRFTGNSSEQILEEISVSQAEPAVDWSNIEETGDNPAPVIATDSAQEENQQPLPPPVQTVSEVDVVRVKVQNQTAQVDLEAVGVTQAAEVTEADGSTQFVMEYGEANLNELILTNVNSQMPPELEDQVQLDRIDLQPGALVVMGQVNAGFAGWQSMNIIAAVGADGQSVDIVSIDVGGIAIDPNSSEITQSLIGPAQDEINTALREAAVISGAGQELPLSQIYIGDGFLQMVFEN